MGNVHSGPNLMWTQSHASSPKWLPKSTMMFPNMPVWTVVHHGASCVVRVAQSTILARNRVLSEWGAAKTKFSFFCEHSHTGVYTHPADRYPEYIEYW